MVSSDTTKTADIFYSRQGFYVRVPTSRYRYLYFNLRVHVKEDTDPQRLSSTNGYGMVQTDEMTKV